MLNLITGGAGKGKSYEMMCRIKESTAAGKKVFAVCPDQFNFEYNRMLYNFMGPELFNRMEVLNFSRIAKYIFIAHGGLKGKYADDTVRTVMMYRALSDLNKTGSLNFYSGQARKTSFVTAALEFARTLSTGGIAPDDILRCLPLMNGSIREKAEDIALICSEYNRLMEESGFKDNRTDITEAAKKAAQTDFFAGSEYYIDEFKSFTPDESELLKIIIRDSDSLTVCLTTEDTSPAKYSLFDVCNHTLASLSTMASECGIKINRTHLTENRRFNSPETEFLSSHILRTATAHYEGEKAPDCPVKVFEAAEIYEEADFTAAEINHLVREKGYKYSDIAVTARNAENYSLVLTAAFERSNIPYYTEENSPISHKALIIFVCTALRITAEKSPSTEELLRYIRTGYAGLDINSSDILEEYCYRWNVDGKMWHEPFMIHDKDTSDGAHPTHDETAENARQAVITPLLNLKKHSGNSAAEYCRGITGFLEETGAADTVKRMIADAEAVGDTALQYAREAKQLWEELMNLLTCFYRTLGNEVIPPKEFSALFETAVSGMTLSSPPQTLDCVRFSPSNMTRFASPKAVFVLGANEGIFPFAAKPSPLLTDKDIAELNKSGIEIHGSSREKQAEERFTAYAALSAASERVYVSYPVSDTGGKPLYPSLAVKSIINMFGRDIVLTGEKLGILYLCTTEQSGYYRYVQSFKRNSADISSLRCALEKVRPENKERFFYLDNPSTVRHTLDVSRHTPDRLFGNAITLSASRFEDYRLCPFMYFCKKGLNIYPRTKTEMNAPSKGTAVHYCLCELLKECGRDRILSMSENDINSIIKSKLSEYFEQSETGGSYGKSARYLASYSRLSDTITDIMLHLKAELAQSEFCPSDFEYTLAFDGDEKPAKLKCPDGTEIYFIGAVDRIDVYNKDGVTYIRVVDYKTGTKNFSYADLYYGLNMQMLLYLFALTDPDAPVNEGKYHATVPAGVLYVHAKDNVPSLPRDASEKDTEDKKCGGERMDGVVISDISILNAMDKDISGVFIPAKTLAGGGFSKGSSVISEKQLEKLRKYTRELVTETAAEVKSGHFEADPLVQKDSSPCSYCEYSSVCGNYPNIISRKADPDAGEKMLAIISNDDDNKEE